MDGGELMKRWHSMQLCINSMIDSTKGEKREAELAKGVRQELERKEGLMRMNMMGKRVIYECVDEYAYACVCACVCVYAYVYARACAFAYVSVYANASVYACASACAYVCVYACRSTLRAGR